MSKYVPMQWKYADGVEQDAHVKDYIEQQAHQNLDLYQQLRQTAENNIKPKYNNPEYWEYIDDVNIELNRLYWEYIESIYL